MLVGNRRGIGWLAPALVLAALGSAAAASAGQQSGQLVAAAAGQIAGVRWKIGMGLIDGERCYASIVINEGWESDGRICGGEEPPRRTIATSIGAYDEPHVELIVTAERVWRLRLLVAHPGSGEAPRWHSIRTRSLSRNQARISGLPRDFRFLVFTDPVRACVEGFEAFGRQGARIDAQSMPCED